MTDALTDPDVRPDTDPVLIEDPADDVAPDPTTLAPDGGDEPPEEPPSRRPLLVRLTEIPVEGWVTAAIVGVCVLFVFAQLHPALAK